MIIRVSNKGKFGPSSRQAYLREDLPLTDCLVALPYMRLAHFHSGKAERRAYPVRCSQESRREYHSARQKNGVRLRTSSMGTGLAGVSRVASNCTTLILSFGPPRPNMDDIAIVT
jgi:hypothetical protein